MIGKYSEKWEASHTTHQQLFLAKIIYCFVLYRFFHQEAGPNFQRPPEAAAHAMQVWTHVRSRLNSHWLRQEPITAVGKRLHFDMQRIIERLHISWHMFRLLLDALLWADRRFLAGAGPSRTIFCAAASREASSSLSWSNCSSWSLSWATNGGVLLLNRSV